MILEKICSNVGRTLPECHFVNRVRVISCITIIDGITYARDYSDLTGVKV